MPTVRFTRQRSASMIGRDAELRAIQQVLTSTRDGRGRAVFVLGEPGVGKSRLAAAAADFAFATNMSLLLGRSSSVGLAAPFRPLTEALLSFTRGSTRVDPRDLGPYQPVLARLIPDWGPPPAEGDGASLVVLAEAILRLTGLAGGEHGCLLTLEDLHHADTETLAVVEYLIGNVERQPTVLLATLRSQPGAALDLVRDASTRGAAMLIDLVNLDRDQLVEVAASCLAISPSDVLGRLADVLWAGSAGNPLLIEELLNGATDSGMLTFEHSGWRMSDRPTVEFAETLVPSISQRIASFDERTRDLIMVAATLGRRFPVSILGEVMGLSDRAVLAALHADRAAQFVTADDQTPGWYAFHHQLVVDALLAGIPGSRRRALSATVADAVAAVYPDLPGEWCQICASLRVEAGELRAAGILLTEAGRRALAQGAAGSAVGLLDTASDLLARADPSLRADTLETLLYALAEAGMVERALTSIDLLDEVGVGLDPLRRARLRTRLAWAAQLAGRWADSLAQVDAARALLGPDASPENMAPIDLLAAHLALDKLGGDRIGNAESLARRAAEVAEAVPLPVVACQALLLLGMLTRFSDPDEATRCLERSRSIAVQHNLPIWEIYSLVRLGSDDVLRGGDADRLELARERAARLGAVTARYQADSGIALMAILRADFAPASALVDEVFAGASRLGLSETVQFALALRAVLFGHQARRTEMEQAVVEIRDWTGDWGGDQAMHAPRVYGLARTFCALLEENRTLAAQDLTTALRADEANPTVYHLTGRYGLDLLLRALDGTLTLEDYTRTTNAPSSKFPWDRQFALLARAVLHGRAGEFTAAAQDVEAAVANGRGYPMARHLALRLVSESALADGWGDPIPWLREAEQYFHNAEIPAVAGACRALLRRAGVKVAQRRDGADEIPARLRSAGITVREYEVLLLLVDRLGNREIADKLHLSTRTVERYVSNLITKTGLPNRKALIGLVTSA